MRSWRTGIVTPAACTRPISGNVIEPSPSTRYLPDRSGSSNTVTVRRSSAPTTYRCAGTGVGASDFAAAGFSCSAAAGGAGVWTTAGACAPSAKVRNHVAATKVVIGVSTLIRHARQRNSELARFPVQIGTMHPERLRRCGHAPAVMLEHRGDVLALEAKTRLAQVAARLERGQGAIEAQQRQQMFDPNRNVGRFGGDT